MKKFLQLFIIVCMPVFTFGQYVEANWQVEDNTTSVNGVDDIQNNFLSYSNNQYTLTSINDILKIDFTNKDYPSNYEDIFCKTISWTGTSSNYFTKDLQGNPQDHKIAEGTTVDFTNPMNRIVTFEVQSDKYTVFYPNLVDINGKISNANFIAWYTLPVSGGIDLQDETKWTKITFAWNNAITANAKCSTMEDKYTPLWLERANDNTNLDSFPLDSTRIAGILLTIDPDNTGDIGEQKTIYIRNLTIGTPIIHHISDINLTKENKSVVINLEDYYGGNDIPTYDANILAGSDLAISQANSLITISANDLCSNFTNVITFTITDPSGTYSQNVNVNFESKPIAIPSIGVVTVDTTGTYLQIVWERPVADYINKYKIYREGLANVYQEIGELPYDSVSVYVDETAFFNNRSYRYKISAVDECDIETGMSEPHNSIHLQKVPIGNELQLNWSQYQGAPVLGYRLKEGTCYSDMTTIDEFSQLSYTITNPGSKLYRIETIMENSVNPKLEKTETGPFILAYSNIAESETNITTLHSEKFTVFENQKGSISYQYSANKTGSYIVSVYTSNGQLVDEKFYSKTSTVQGLVNVPNGMYTVTISDGKNIISKQVVIN
jgi:hypothetical protein